MTYAVRQTDGFWDNLERTVSDKVAHALRDRDEGREALIEYLRHLEGLARDDGRRRQTVQIIASGRSLLGDRQAVAARPGTQSVTGGRTGKEGRPQVSLASRV